MYECQPFKNLTILYGYFEMSKYCLYKFLLSKWHLMFIILRRKTEAKTNQTYILQGITPIIIVSYHNCCMGKCQADEIIPRGRGICGLPEMGGKSAKHSACAGHLSSAYLGNGRGI
jgi:hypothetical protein